MRKRNVVLLGGLIAGAFLLPTVAGAAVSGVCSNCHTMHNSQDGAPVVAGGPYANLLAAADCTGCHANAEENAANGRGNGAIGAPQVDNVTNATGDGAANGYVLNAGYFEDAANDNTHHNVQGIDATSDGNIAGGVSPGGGFAIDNGSGAPALTCQDCHAGSGAHHSSSPSAYRILAGGNRSTSAQTDYGAKAAGAGAFPGTRSEVVYQATDMNNFCAGCHGNFHGLANQQSATPGTWLLHPTDIQVTNGATAPSIVNLLNSGDTDTVVVGSTVATPTTGAAGTDGTVMCISCHVPHGGPYADMLAFDYTAVQAGDGTATVGCETCHDYGTGM